MTTPKRFLFFFLLISCTQQEAIQKPSVFFVLGDWGKRGIPNQQVVANQMNEWAAIENPDFIITTGDNFYDVGVADVNDSHWTESFEQVYKGSRIKSKTWYATLGNHDYVTNPQAEVDYSIKNTRWQLPSYYYQKIISLGSGAKLRLIFMDTSPFEKSYYHSSFADNIKKQDTVKQKRWLDSLTSLTDATWKVVIGHHHIYTGGVRKNDPNSVRNSIEPILIKNKVDVYFCGHEHDLQHMKDNAKPTHYFLSGAGADLRPTGSIPQTLFAQSIQGFMSVTVKQSSLHVKVISYKGDVIYQYLIER
jgi:tartrate-resistant acid phosphatase type 5